jgi:hypothetical protein
MLIISTDEAADTLDGDIQSFRDAIEVLARPGVELKLRNTHAIYLVDPESAFWHVRLGQLDALMMATWVFLGMYDQLFKESGRLAALCDAVGLNLGKVRSQLRSELDRKFKGTEMYDVNVFAYRSMADWIVERATHLEH